MEELQRLFDTVLNKDFIRAVISNPREKGGIAKVKIRPLELKGQLVFQFESFTAKQAFHKNLDRDAAVQELSGCAGEFRQMQIETADAEYTVLISKKGKATIKRKQRREKAQAADLSHNRQKRYILEEGKFVPFLRDLRTGRSSGRGRTSSGRSTGSLSLSRISCRSLTGTGNLRSLTSGAESRILHLPCIIICMS